jgi:hypothetical protein
MSESSKKEKSLYSPNGGRTSPNASQDGEKVMEGEDERRATGSIGVAFCVTREVDSTGDDSSSSSFYSFLKTDNSDTSMKSSSEYMNANDVRKAGVSTTKIEMYKLLCISLLIWNFPLKQF